MIVSTISTYCASENSPVIHSQTWQRRLPSHRLPFILVLLERHNLVSNKQPRSHRTPNQTGDGSDCRCITIAKKEKLNHFCRQLGNTGQEEYAAKQQSALPNTQRSVHEANHQTQLQNAVALPQCTPIYRNVLEQQPEGK